VLPFADVQFGEERHVGHVSYRYRRGSTAKGFVLVASAAVLFSPHVAFADDSGALRNAPPPIDGFHELETKYIFGFTTGADIGVPGEQSVEFETTAAFQKRGGHYSAVEQEIEFEGVPTDFFSYELSVHGSYHSIGGTIGLDDLNRTGFSGLSTALSFAILHRGPESPIGLTFVAEPEWERIDGGSGQFARNFSTSFTIVADTELIANRLYGAVNLSYEPEVGKAADDIDWDHSSTLGVTAALAYRISPKVTLGGELEYYRAYDGLLFDTFDGNAFYAGPTLHVQFDSKTMLAAAFSTQVAGQAVGEHNALDLTNFERYHFNLKFEKEF
jgi:Putative MetA-pathway of phenol degradation